MQSKIIGALLGLAAAAGIQAAETALVYEFAVEPGKAGVFAEAFTQLQNTEIAQDRKAQIQLQSSSFNGANPATHRVTVLYPSLQEFETWMAKFNGSQAQVAFQEATSSVATPVSQYMANPLKSWGEVSSADQTWDIARIGATNPVAVLQGLDALMAAPDTQDFPGQLWLVQVSRGQASPAGHVSHEIVVGYESLAEMETWMDTLVQTEAWSTWLGVAAQSFTITNRYHINWLTAFEHGYTLEDFE